MGPTLTDHLKDFVKTNSPISHPCGVGLRFEHHRPLLAQKPDVGWLEVHPENYFEGIFLETLKKYRQHYPISLHSVGVSLGTADRLDTQQLDNFKNIIDIIDPMLVSEHVSWTAVDGVFLNDLIPLPFTEEALNILCRNIQQTQEHLGRQILIENPSSYLSFKHSTMPETEFICETVKRTGCGLLLDVNNVYVSSQNLNFDPKAYITALKDANVVEYHLAGHSSSAIEDNTSILLDTHSDVVCDEVWELYEYALETIGLRYTMVEWDADLPDVTGLVAEAHKAAKRCEPHMDQFKAFPGQERTNEAA